jgi:hypothetical protein
LCFIQEVGALAPVGGENLAQFSPLLPILMNSEFSSSLNVERYIYFALSRCLQTCLKGILFAEITPAARENSCVVRRGELSMPAALAVLDALTPPRSITSFAVLTIWTAQIVFMIPRLARIQAGIFTIRRVISAVSPIRPGFLSKALLLSVVSTQVPLAIYLIMY